MEYLIVITIICVVVVAVIGVTVFFKKKSKQVINKWDNQLAVTDNMEIVNRDNALQEILIQMEMLPADSIPDKNKLIEITDSKVLAKVNNLIPGLAQAGNAANNAMQVLQGNGEVLYRAILPAGAKLTDSKAMENAVRGIYHGADGIKGHANFMAVKAQKGTEAIANATAAAMGVAAMIVGQYYMTQINSELGVISDGVSKISEFQNDEYRSRVFSLITHVKKIADFQIEILENQELRLSKIAQLNNLEEECAKLLGQANLALARYAGKKKLDYDAYEKELKEAQDWYMYQKSLLEVLYKISDLIYALHLGNVSREQCNAILPTYTKQVSDTQDRLSDWHQENTINLKIDTDEKRRKRAGIDGAIHFIPGLIKEDMRFKAINNNTVNMITTQTSGFETANAQDTTDLYEEDVQLIAKDGKIYYFPPITMQATMKGE